MFIWLFAAYVGHVGSLYLLRSDRNTENTSIDTIIIYYSLFCESVT